MDIINQNKNLMVCTDIMFVCSIVFFMSISQNIKFTMVEMIENRKHTTILNCILNIYNIYKRQRFNVKALLTDGEFKYIDTSKYNIMVNTTAVNKCVLEIERQICVIKELTRAAWSVLPFKYKPKL